MRKRRTLAPWLISWLGAACAVTFAGSVNSTAAAANTDARVAAAIDGLEARDQLLREVLVSYHLRAVRPAAGSADRQAGAEVNRTHAIWARKGRRLRYEQTVWLPGKPIAIRSQHVYDGEKILSRYYNPPPYDRRKPREQVSSGPPVLGIIQSGGDAVGLTYWGAPLCECLRQAANVRCLGYERIGVDRCLVLELKSREGQDRRARWWLDVGHGLLLRKSQQRERGQLVTELLATQPREWGPGVFLASHLLHEISSFRPAEQSDRPVLPRAPTFVWTVDVQRVAFARLSDRLFNTNPSDKSAFDTRSGNTYGVLPRRPTEHELDELTDTARRWLTARSCPVRTKMKGYPGETPECGPQSLYIVCRLLGVRTSIDELCRQSKAGIDGTTLLGLRNAARAQGLTADGVRLPLADLLRYRGPVIGVLPYHFYVVVGFRGSSAVIISPPDTIAVVPEAKLRAAWDGRALVARRVK